MATTLSIERLGELAEDGAAAMVVVAADERQRCADWTHAAGPYRELREGGIEVLIYSRAAGLTYHVTAGYCTCPHYERRCQREDGGACKHMLRMFPGGKPPAGVRAITVAERALQLARELAEDLG